MSSRSPLGIGWLLLFYLCVFGFLTQCSQLDFGNVYEQALTHYNDKNWDEALTHFLQVEAQIAALAPTELDRLNETKWDQVQRTYRSIVQIYQDDSNFDQAKIFAEKGLAFAIQRYGENTLPLYKDYHLYGELFRLSREYDKAMEYSEKALYLLQQSSDLSYVSTNLDSAQAAVLNSLGHIGYYNDLGEATTMRYYQSSLSLTQQRPDLLPLRIYSLLGQSRFYAEKKQFDQAILPLQLADSLWQDKQQALLAYPDYYDLKRKLIRQHGYYWKRQNEYDKAISHYREYLRITDQHFNTPRAHVYLLTTIEISEIYRHAWQYGGDRDSEGISRGDSSVYYAHQALIKSCDDFSPSSIFDVPRLENIREKNFSLFIIRTLARLNQQLVFERGTTAEKINALKLAIAYIDLADQLYDEVLKESINLKGYINQNLIDLATLIYDTGLIFTYELYELAPSEETLEKTFYFIQKMKALQFLIDQQKEEALQKSNLPDSILRQEEAFLQEIRDIENRIYQAELRGDSLLVEKLEHTTRFDLKRSYARFQHTLHENYPAYHLEKYQFSPISIKELKSTLNEGEVVLDFAGSGVIDFVIAVEKDGHALFERLSLGSVDKVEARQAIEELNSLLQRSAMHRKSSRTKFVRLSHYLYQRYLAAVEPILKDKQRVIIIGDGLTNYIPFEVLLAQEEPKAFHELNYLVKNYELSYHYSSSIFAKARQQTIDLPPSMYAFAPVYDQGAQLSVPGPEQGSNKNIALRAFDDSGNLVPLPASEREVEEINQLFQSHFPDSSRIDLRSKATEATLKANLERAHRIIHIAAHSFADLNNPLFSGIACHSPAGSNSNSNMLYMGEIYALNTQADLITLSSCESGFGRALESDGLVGLNRAFVLAGTPNVVFSLWKVYDKVSAQMMIQFYDHILQGNNYASSLRAAKLNLINDPVTASPHYWSPYLLIGR